MTVCLRLSCCGFFKRVRNSSSLDGIGRPGGDLVLSESFRRRHGRFELSDGGGPLSGSEGHLAVARGLLLPGPRIAGRGLELAEGRRPLADDRRRRRFHLSRRVGQLADRSFFLPRRLTADVARRRRLRLTRRVGQLADGRLLLSRR